MVTNLSPSDFSFSASSMISDIETAPFRVCFTTRLRLNQRIATVDNNGLPGNILIFQQEFECRSDLVGPRRTLERDSVHKPLPLFVSDDIGLEHEPRGNSVDPDPRGKRSCENPGQGVEGSFAYGIGWIPAPGLLCPDIRDIDNEPALGHFTCTFLRKEKRRAQVQVERSIPVLKA